MVGVTDQKIIDIDEKSDSHRCKKSQGLQIPSEPLGVQDPFHRKLVRSLAQPTPDFPAEPVDVIEGSGHGLF